MMTAWSIAASGQVEERYDVLFQPRNGTHQLRSTGANPDDFIASHQAVVADSYRGQRVRFRAELKGDPGLATPRWAGLWMRVEDAEGRVLSSGRVPLRPVERDWHAAEVILPIPAEAHRFGYGLLLAGQGTASMRNLTVDRIDR